MNPLHNQKGMALLLVLVVVALLSSLLVEFSFSTLVDLRATETFRDRTKAYYLARGGVEAARMILREDRNKFDHASEFWGDLLAGIPVGDGDVSLKIEDFSGRFNLNSVADNRGNRQPGYHRFIALCKELLAIDDTEARLLADALVYWFDADRTRVTPDDGYYAEQQPAYSRKGGHLDTLDELQMVRGFEAEIIKRLKNHVRVFGDEAINVNTASAAVLYAWQFSAAEGNIEIIFDQQDIAALLSYRRRSPYRQLSDLALAEGVNDRWAAAWLAGSVRVKGSLFKVESRGRINQVSRVAQALIMKDGNQLLSLKVE
jgi:general secretion pathway protein K